MSECAYLCVHACVCNGIETYIRKQEYPVTPEDISYTCCLGGNIIKIILVKKCLTTLLLKKNKKNNLPHVLFVASALAVCNQLKKIKAH